MDCSIEQHKVYPEFFTLSTTDFFFPLIDDPYLQGKVACANVLSDMYSLGIDRCDSMLMLLGGSLQMTPDERHVIMKQMIRGFSDLAVEAGTKVSGGQTVLNEWPLIGGVAMTMAKEQEFIRPENIVPGDVFVLTKPLGTQVSVNLREWTEEPERWKKVEDVITVEEVRRAYFISIESMSRLNRNGARLMQKYHAHGSTDITGFGILGHASNLAKNQKADIDIILHTLPIIRSMVAVDKKVNIFRLLQGFSAETSGGLFVGLPSMEAAQQFVEEISRLDGQPAWIVGVATAGSGVAKIAEDVQIIEV